MNKIKGFVTVALISVITGSTLFAAPNNLNGKNVSGKKYDKVNNHHIEKIEKKPETKLQVLTGKIKVTEGGFVTFKVNGQGGRRYILTTDNLSFGTDRLTIDGKKSTFEKVSMKSIKSQNGKSITLEGRLNEESGVFTVLRLSGSGKNSASNPGTAK